MFRNILTMHNSDLSNNKNLAQKSISPRLFVMLEIRNYVISIFIRRTKVFGSLTMSEWAWLRQRRRRLVNTGFNVLEAFTTLSRPPLPLGCSIGSRLLMLWPLSFCQYGVGTIMSGVSKCFNVYSSCNSSLVKHVCVLCIW